ncbi:radical SAM protein [bacterium]|nr:radical SAM protein [candidate division CSSED10-310 bacterium]
MKMESPDYLRTSLAAAMTLKLKPGWFYRNAKLGCINLLLDYHDGCCANCAYCGLSRTRQGDFSSKSFIRVSWPKYPLETIIKRMATMEKDLGRICLSMITHRRAVKDTVDIIERIQKTIHLPISLLISPSIVTVTDLRTFKNSGADKIGIAVDAATPLLFDTFRGKGVNGPHSWDRYWTCFKEAVDVYGAGNVGSHLIVGLGESEQEMVEAFLKTRRYGGSTHLFSFFPEDGSALAKQPPCSMGQYRRMQLARFLIDETEIPTDFTFDNLGQLTDYGLTSHEIKHLLSSGKPFMTSGCTGGNGIVACNRPYANSQPGPDIRNYPFTPNYQDIQKISSEIFTYE